MKVLLTAKNGDQTVVEADTIQVCCATCGEFLPVFSFTCLNCIKKNASSALKEKKK